MPRRDGRRSHGTLIAGLIAQTTDNAIGGAGVAPDAAIMPVRVLRPDLGGSARAIARGLRFAVDHGADVVNLSIAGPSPARALTSAVEYAAAKGVTVVAAAGNDGLAAVSWPAADPTVIAVGAVGRDLVRAGYSNHGPELDLVAPAGAGERPDSGSGPSDGVLAQTPKGAPARPRAGGRPGAGLARARACSPCACGDAAGGRRTTPKLVVTPMADCRLDPRSRTRAPHAGFALVRLTRRRRGRAA